MTVLEQILSKYLKEIGCGNYAEELLQYNPDEIIEAVKKGFKEWLQQKRKEIGEKYVKIPIDELIEELEND